MEKRGKTKHEAENHGRSPLEMLEIIHREITSICGLLEHEPNTGVAVRITQLRWRLNEYLTKARNREAWVRRGRQLP